MYEEIRIKLNKMFPERLELKVGCEVSYLDFRDRINKGYIYGGESINGYPLLSKCHNVFIEKKEAHTLLTEGQPVTLQDILRGLGDKVDVHNNQDVKKGETSGQYLTLFDNYEESKSTIITLDLSIPPKDWEEETLTAINELL